LVLGSWFLVLGSWFLVLGSWFLVLGSWFLVLGSWFLVARLPTPIIVLLLEKQYSWSATMGYHIITRPQIPKIPKITVMNNTYFISAAKLLEVSDTEKRA
jgi:hypothetical protein